MANPQQVGAFIQTTALYDAAAQLQQTDVNSPEFKELLIKLYQTVNNISILLNLKTTGYYSTQEFVTGELLYPNPLYNSSTSTNAAFRQVMSKTIVMGALSNAGTTTVPHGITVTANTRWVDMMATATNTTGLTGIQISNGIGFECSINTTATNVVITTTVDLSMFDYCIVVLKYVQS